MTIIPIGSPPPAAISLELICTANLPISATAPVIGSVESRQILSSIVRAEQSSPIDGLTKTSSLSMLYLFIGSNTILFKRLLGNLPIFIQSLLARIIAYK